ncbi:uncharacterized protein LACBIDRAFT_304595 [Laccaria bicolor S238N-H82]|uniref:Predicted protein n=1 Tax=Laccaria bicolor (strain S238N-H82 / ATCC MYA-4686) TaxID=486041 RepID=B0DLZ3_LACBS|nr:uncharacterized protein LACBIDRAFT_304595 [Laccaria bicolor S238N-H82]EDR04379.1 predicted protein [Laccaria bicolor S238N-H82]|eukprot:XP_001884898.1 predicted protein [Laccaria bicolor S238N-H82]
MAIMSHAQNTTFLEWRAFDRQFTNSVEVAFKGYLVEPWGLTPYYSALGRESIARPVGVIQSVGAQNAPWFNGELLYINSYQISNFKLACLYSEKSFIYGLAVIGGFLQMVDVKKQGISLKALFRDTDITNVRMHEPDVVGASLVSPDPFDIVFEIDSTPAIVRGSLVPQSDYINRFAQLLEPTMTIVRLEYRFLFCQAFEEGTMIPDWIFEGRAPYLVHCIHRARQKLWTEILCSSTIAAGEDAAKNDAMIQNFIYNI